MGGTHGHFEIVFDTICSCIEFLCTKFIDNQHNTKVIPVVVSKRKCQYSVYQLVWNELGYTVPLDQSVL